MATIFIGYEYCCIGVIGMDIVYMGGGGGRLVPKVIAVVVRTTSEEPLMSQLIIPHLKPFVIIRFVGTGSKSVLAM